MKRRKINFFISVIVLTLVTIFIYLLERTGYPQRDLFRYLYFIPIGYAAFYFGASGGFYMGIASTALYIPLLIADLDKTGFDSRSIEIQVTLIIFIILGFTAGYLFEKNQKKKTDYHILYRLSKTMTSSILPEKIYNDFLKTTLRILNALRGVILIKDNNYFFIGANLGYKEDERYLLKTFNSEPQSTILNLVYSTGKNLIVNNPSFDSRFTISREQSSLCKQFIVLPIAEKNSKIGLLLIEGKRNNNVFNKEEIKLLNTALSTLSLAISNINLHNLATIDGLTNLYVHRYFEKRLEREINDAKKNNHNLSLIMADIDKFKTINDTYGHQQGDIVLQEVARIIIKNSISDFVPCRYGGEEFAIICPKQDKFEAARYAEKIRQLIENHIFILKDTEVKITLSLGVSSFPADTSYAKQLVEKSDQALYQAKQTGRNRVCIDQTNSIS